MYRKRDWRRYKDYIKAKRKRDIDKKTQHVFNDEYGMHWWFWYNNLHQYSKNKIHCSCPMCSAKTRNKGHRRKRKNYAPAINYRRMDMRRQMAMTADEQEYNNPFIKE